MTSLSIREKGTDYKGFVKCACVVLIVTLALSAIANAGKVSDAKDFRHEEKYGKLKKVKKKVKSYWRIFLWLVKQVSILVLKAMIVLFAAHILGMLEIAVAWLVWWLTVREILLNIAMISPQHSKLYWVIVKTTQKILMLALIGTIILAMPQQCEASASTIAINSSQNVVGTLATALGAGGLIQSQAESFLENIDPIRKRYKISLCDQIALYHKLCENPEMPSSEIKKAFSWIKISQSQLNRIRREWGLNRKKGRPQQQQDNQNTVQNSIICKAGVSLFATWLEENKQHEKVLETIYELIKQYKRDHPNENFRLLVSTKKTIAKKWKALAILPLLDIGKLSELDYKQHNMQQILGYSYGSSSLRQFLGELERINAGNYLKTILAKSAKGQYCYIDGHMIAFWTRLSMHKGYITNKGKIMPGSNALLAHDEKGKAIAVEFHPPDFHLSHIIEKYCSEIVAETNIRRFVIDREINSPKIARLFIENKWELLCLLSANDYKDENCFSKKFSTRDNDL